MACFSKILFREKSYQRNQSSDKLSLLPLLLTYFVAHIYISYIISVHKAFFTYVFISFKYDNVMYRKRSRIETLVTQATSRTTHSSNFKRLLHLYKQSIFILTLFNLVNTKSCNIYSHHKRLLEHFNMLTDNKEIPL